MSNRKPTLRTAFALTLLMAGLCSTAAAQDLYKSRAEMLNAEAANKAADAAIIGAVANYEKSAAEVAKIGQEIREKAANNDLLEAEVYYKKRAAYHAYQEARRQATSKGRTEPVHDVTRETSARMTAYSSQAASGSSYVWPTLLKGSQYNFACQQIDTLLQSRTAEDSGAGSQNCVQIMRFIGDLKDKLRTNIRLYSSHDYLAARNFLDALVQEVQQPITVADETLDKVAGN